MAPASSQGGVLVRRGPGDFRATWYHFPGNFHRYVLRVGCLLARKSTGFRQADFSTVFFGFQYGYRFSPWRACRRRSPTLEVVDVVRWAPNLHIFDSTHQDLTLHREGRLISDGITPYCLEK